MELRSMAFRYIVDDVRRIAAGVWEARLDPNDVRSLGRTSAEGQRSIVGLRGIDLAEGGGALSFLPGGATVFVLGESDQALLIDLESGVPEGRGGKGSAQPRNGDVAFLAQCGDLLDPPTSRLGQTLLKRFRDACGGDLSEAKNRKWVNRPRNVFTITPQTRNKAFRISIKGAPSAHVGARLTLLPGRNGYCEFLVKAEAEIDEAVRLVREASKL